MYIVKKIGHLLKFYKGGSMLNKIENKLYELEMRCRKKRGDDKCFEIAFKAWIATIATLILFYVSMMYFFTDFTLKFTLLMLIVILATITVLLIKDLIFFAIKFLTNKG